jgi:single-stranded-DNA-specific exonuclease
MLPRTKKAGLQALLRTSGLWSQTAKLTVRSLGFNLGPRINAVGRLDAAAHALELMLTSDHARAQELADLLERCNQERQAMQSRIFEDAFDQARALDPAQHPILVLAAERWHSGVIGIVASKIVEAFSRPAILIALDGDGSRGSARSVHGFNIYQAISACKELLGRCGGHEAAAGFDITAERVEEFRRAVCRVAAEQISTDTFVPRLDLEALLDAHELEMSLAHELARLEPFGHGNPVPVFATRALRLAQFQILQAKRPLDRDHLKLFLSADGGPPVQAMYWRSGHMAQDLAPDMPLDVCYALEINEFRGERSLQLNVKDLRIAQEPA